ncbi:MAG: MBOAT family protein, partial [Planctomycetes bacterium]|nr:MBOAT family protein [Planctomycetota bacterium]
MLFHTWIFFAFFLLFYAVYLCLHRTRLMNLWILIGSYVFYGWWNPLYLALIIIPTTVDYFAVRLMERTGRRKLWLCASLLANLGFLAAFKYAGFITENLNAVLA